MDRVKRRWWTATTTLLALVVVTATVLSGLFQLAVMALPSYREQLADYVSRVAARPIDIGGVALVWHRFRPLLELDDIVLYSDDGETPALSAETLRIGFDLTRLIRGDTFPDQIELSGLQVAVEIDRDDKITLRGFDTAGPAQSLHDWQRELSRFDEIRLTQCTVLVEDARLVGGNPRFQLVKAVAKRRLGGVNLFARLELPSFMGEVAVFEGDLDGDPADAEPLAGRWSLRFEGLSRLPWLEARLPGHPAIQLHDADLRVSGRLQQGRVESADVEFLAKGVVARRDEYLARLQNLALTATARRDERSWTLDVPRFQVSGDSGVWPQTRLRLQWTPLGDGVSEFEADADFLRLQDLAPWVMLAGRQADPRLLGVSGELRSLVVRGRAGGAAPPTYAVSSRLDHLGYASRPHESGPGPGFGGLSGTVSATEAGGRLALDSDAFVLDYSRVFAGPVRFDRLAGQLDWVHDEQGWRLEMPRFGWTLAGTEGEGDLDLRLPVLADASPDIQLDARFSAADVTRLKPYLPAFWSESLRGWLDQGIVAGRVPRARLQIRGKLAEFPFRDGNGVFALDLDVANARIAYAPGWPAAEQVSAELAFRGDGLSIKVDGGRLGGGRIGHVDASIAQFRDPHLEVRGEVEGAAETFYAFLRESPIAGRLAGLLDHTQGRGATRVSLHLAIPLRSVRDTQVDGRVHLDGAELLYTGLDEPFRELSGDIDFSLDGARSERVSGRFYGAPVTARLQAEGHGATRLQAEADHALQRDGSGLSRFVPALLRPYVDGNVQVHAEALFGAGDGAVVLSSDLVGVEVDLPAPVGKLAEVAARLRVQIGGRAAPATLLPALDDGAGTALRVGVAYAGRLGADVWLRPRPDGTGLATERVLIALGSDALPEARDRGVRIIGQVEDLDVSEWLGRLRRRDPVAVVAIVPDPDPGLRLESVDLSARRLHLDDYGVGSVHIGYRPGAGGDWSAELAGDGATGTLQWIGGGAPQLIARFRHLRVEGRKATPELTPSPRPAPDPLDPNRLPTLDLECEECELGAARLGQVRVRTQRIDGGQRLAQLTATGADAELQGSGDWLRRAGASLGSLRFSLQSRSIGETLEGLGYARHLSAEKSRFEADLQWVPTVAGLDWRQAEGHIGLDLEKGTLRAVEPGAGRVLGLLNFYALPRRLTLDFRDVTSKGLGFDAVTGDFELAGGNATTRDLTIRSPSLKIDLKGRVGLSARDYDQHVSVYPDVSGGVTLGALLLGGPAFGVVALLAQQLLDKPLDQVTQLSYAVTGSWDNPQVERAQD